MKLFSVSLSVGNAGRILGLATDTVKILILMIKTTMPKPDLDPSGFPWIPGTCTQDWTGPAKDQSIHGSATSAETEGEQGVLSIIW